MEILLDNYVNSFEENCKNYDWVDNVFKNLNFLEYYVEQNNLNQHVVDLLHSFFNENKISFIEKIKEKYGIIPEIYYFYKNEDDKYKFTEQLFQNNVSSTTKNAIIISNLIDERKYFKFSKIEPIFTNESDFFIPINRFAISKDDEKCAEVKIEGRKIIVDGDQRLKEWFDYRNKNNHSKIFFLEKTENNKNIVDFCKKNYLLIISEFKLNVNSLKTEDDGNSFKVRAYTNQFWKPTSNTVETIDGKSILTLNIV